MPFSAHNREQYSIQHQSVSTYWPPLNSLVLTSLAPPLLDFSSQLLALAINLYTATKYEP